MINKRIFLSGLSIVSAFTLMVGGTFAFFSDTATSTGNTFSSGTLEFQLRDNNESFTDAVTASTVATGMVPGGDLVKSYICFKNNGDTPIEEILLHMTATGNVNELAPWIKTTKIELKAVVPGECDNFDSGGFGPGDDFTSLFVSRFDGAGGQPTGDGVSLYEQLYDVLGDDRTEDDLLNGSAVLPADPDVLLKLRTTWEMDDDAPNSAQDRSLTVDTTFTARQDEL